VLGSHCCCTGLVAAAVSVLAEASVQAEVLALAELVAAREVQVLDLALLRCIP